MRFTASRISPSVIRVISGVDGDRSANFYGSDSKVRSHIITRFRVSTFNILLIDQPVELGSGSWKCWWQSGVILPVGGGGSRRWCYTSGVVVVIGGGGPVLSIAGRNSLGCVGRLFV
jgi:hypothetical protein